MKKQHLPQKICVYCQRPFDWRKKWERCWEEVKYCSERCKRQARSNKKIFHRVVLTDSTLLFIVESVVFQLIIFDGLKHIYTDENSKLVQLLVNVIADAWFYALPYAYARV